MPCMLRTGPKLRGRAQDSPGRAGADSQRRGQPDGDRRRGRIQQGVRRSARGSQLDRGGSAAER